MIDQKKGKPPMTKPKPTEKQQQLNALKSLVEAKRRLWAAWDKFEAILGKKVCKRTEADADRALSNLVIAGGEKITSADLALFRSVIAWEGLGPPRPAVVALTDAAVAAVQKAIRAAANISDERRRRSLDLEGAPDGECRVGVLAEMPRMRRRLQRGGQP